MKDSLSINGRDLCDSIPDSEEFGSGTATTSRRGGPVAQFDLDDDYDIDTTFDVVIPTENEGDDHADE